MSPRLKAAVITVSDMGSRGERDDTAGDALERLLLESGAQSVSRVSVPDERADIAAALIDCCDVRRADVVITAGGTGLSPRDVTPEATLEVIDREAPGFAEAIRAGSMKMTPRAMLSRGVCGVRGSTLIINFPGSEKACVESFAVIVPALTHALETLAGGSDCAR